MLRVISPRGLAALAAVVLTCSHPWAGERAAGPGLQPGGPAPAAADGVLELGVPITRTLPPRGTASLRVAADAPAFLHLVVEGAGTRLRVSLAAASVALPDVSARIRDAGDRTPVVWSVSVPAPTTLLLRLESMETEDDRTVAIRLTERRAAEPADAARIEAEALLERGPGDPLSRATQALAAADAARDVALQVRALVRVGTVLADAGRSAEAEPVLRDARERCQNLPGSTCSADTEIALGKLLASTGRTDAGFAAFDAARAAADRRGDAAAVAEAWMERGGYEIARAQHDQARRTLTRATEVARAAGHRRAEADALNMLGILAANLGEADESERQYRAALALRRAIGDEAGQAQSESNLGALANSMGEYRRALGHFADALATRRRLGLAQATANTLHNLGVATANLGALEAALGHLEEALGIWQATGGRRGEAFALQELGQTYARLGDRTRALDHWRRARPLWIALGDRRGEVQTVLFAAATEMDGGAIAAASASYAAALDLARSAQLRREQGMAMLGRAGVARRRGDLEVAMAEAREAFAIFDAIPNRRERGRTLAEIGAVHSQAGRLADARIAWLDAVADLDAVEDRAEGGRAAIALADVEARLGDADAATSALMRGLGHLESVRRDQQAESFNLSVFASDRPHYDDAIAVLMRLHAARPDAGFAARAFHVSERRRARRLLDMVTAAAPAGTDEAARQTARELRTAEERIGAKAARLTRLLSDGTVPAARLASAREELRQLVTGADRLRAELQRRHQAPVNDPVVLDAAVVQAQLAPGTVLLEYAIGDATGVGWAISPTRLLAFTVPGRERLDPMVRRFVDAASGRMAAASALPASPGNAAADKGGALAALLLTPAAPLLATASRIVFVGDGLLDAVPVAALPYGQAPLGARFRIATAPSASVAAALRARRENRASAPDRIAVFADPVYSAGDGRVAPASRAVGAGNDLLRLRFSREEAMAIAARAPRRSTLLLDFDATRQRALDGSMAGYRYLHWAGHARIDDAVPQLSTIELSRVDASGRPTNGALRLIDLYGLSLNADLAVLSACGTALGAPVGGEGLVGLASGFLRAGADRVLASLWDVDDRATAAFMTRFYDGLLRDGQPPEEAFHLAQRAIRRDPRWRDTRHWAAWVLVGAGSGSDRRSEPSRPLR